VFIISLAPGANNHAACGGDYKTGHWKEKQAIG